MSLIDDERRKVVRAIVGHESNLHVGHLTMRGMTCPDPAACRGCRFDALPPAPRVWEVTEERKEALLRGLCALDNEYRLESAEILRAMLKEAES